MKNIIAYAALAAAILLGYFLFLKNKKQPETGSFVANPPRRPGLNSPTEVAVKGISAINQVPKLNVGIVTSGPCTGLTGEALIACLGAKTPATPPTNENSLTPSFFTGNGALEYFSGTVGIAETRKPLCTTLALQPPAYAGGVLPGVNCRIGATIKPFLQTTSEIN